MTALIFDTPLDPSGAVFDAQVPEPPVAAVVPISDPEFDAWLADPDAIRTVLFESDVRSGGVEITRYSAQGSFPITGPADTPANTFYDPIVTGGIDFTEQLSLNGSASIAFGDLEFDNTNFVRDGWYLDDIWTGRGERAYLGDPRWNVASYRPIFNGMASGIARKGRGKLGVKLRDQLQRLDTPLTERTLGGTSQSAELLYPSCFGECHNVTPVYDPTTDTYYVHFGPVEWIFEIRVNGLPVSATVDNATGSFRLNNGLAVGGVVTCSVQGDKFGGVYRNTVGALIRRIVTGYGKDDRFTDDDLDLDNFDDFEASHPQRVGIYVSDRTTITNICAQLADSVGAQMIPSRLGKLRLIQIGIGGDSTFDIRPEHMEFRTLTPVSSVDPVAAVKVAFDKNWTVQDNLQTAIQDEFKHLFAEEWLYASDSDDAVKDLYRISTEVIAKNTMLKDRAQAKAEASRRLALWKVKRTMYKFQGTSETLRLELGQQVTVYHHENSMENGVPGVVMLLSPKFKEARCEVGVLV